MLRRLVAAWLALLPALGVASAQESAPAGPLYVRDAGPGEPGRILREVLSKSYTIRWERWNTRLFRDSTIDSTVVVLNSNATVASRVRGDIVVINGDLFLQPGAYVSGRAIAIGGGVYGSQQDTVKGDTLMFFEAHYDTVRTARGLALDWHPPEFPDEGVSLVSLPALYGVRAPRYDRVDGLSAFWGPRVTVHDSALVVDPTVGYRSDLGAFDVAATVRARFAHGWMVDGFAGRGTLTNDDWIQSDLANSVTSLLRGHDYRNYWRADRFEGRIGYAWQPPTGTYTLWGGARTEDDRSVRAGGPWSLTGYDDEDGIIRPNPPIERGRISSALAGGSAEWQGARLTVGGDIMLERAFEAPRDERFTQTTANVRIAFPTFQTGWGEQSVNILAHGVLTTGDSTPPQRFAYLGGLGSLPTFDVLSIGGDRLLWFEGDYNVPIAPLQFGPLPAPVITLREMVGSAGVHRLPRFENNIGLRLTLSIFRADWYHDPTSGDDTFSAGFSMVR